MSERGRRKHVAGRSRGPAPRRPHSPRARAVGGVVSRGRIGSRLPGHGIGPRGGRHRRVPWRCTMSGLGGVEVAILFFFFPFAMLVYAIPTIVAVVRNHHQAVGILVVNVLLGLTMIG